MRRPSKMAANNPTQIASITTSIIHLNYTAIAPQPRPSPARLTPYLVIYLLWILSLLKMLACGRLWTSICSTWRQTCVFGYDISISSVLSGYIDIDIYRYCWIETSGRHGASQSEAVAREDASVPKESTFVPAIGGGGFFQVLIY
ncbi:hypothetical protein BKA56DRAFT_264974 [Ilyonectria sp. MPI-CAGE-AT-0026]|nr:hypothetical protein BKA56DRAFT_264974 [Ilyonectria sp. MPI-CAGE-AT-0026]